MVERAFVIVMGRARAMMNHAGFISAKRQQLWCEAAQTATQLDNILVQDSAKSPPFTQFFSLDAKYTNHLKVSGEMCVVAETDNEVGRTNDRIPSTTPGAEPPRDAKDSGSARSHSTHLETSSSNRP